MKGSRQTRHSKVYTSRGPRDRRVRLSAITAIQFYDVQDRLGYDRPSEAVDWLMLKAKASIEALPQKPITFGKIPLQDLGNGVKNERVSLQHLGVDSVNASASFFPMERPLSLSSTGCTHMPEFNYALGNEDPFPMIGSRENLMLQELPASARPDCEFGPSSCLDQVVFSASLFSKQTSPIKRSVFSSAIASSMEDAPRKHRVLDWPFMTPPSIEF